MMRPRVCVWRRGPTVTTAEKGDPTNCELGDGLTTPHRKETSSLRNDTQGLGYGRISTLICHPYETFQTLFTWLKKKKFRVTGINIRYITRKHL